jgi:acetyl esterase/lipase
MRSFSLVEFGVAAFLLAMPCALWAGKAATPALCRVERDIAYLGTNRTEKADLYLPTNVPQGTLCPAVIVIHGGGWGAGGKADKRERGFCMTLVENGIAAFSIDYQLSPPKRAKEAWPQNIYDCKTAVRWLRQNASRYGIDPDRIGVMGASAGGHLAALLGVTGPDSGLEPKEPLGEVSCRVSAVVDLYGPILIGTGPVPAGDIPPDSPLKYLGKQSPPFLLLHGTEDKGVPIARSREFAAALKQAGVEYELIEVEGAKHSFGLQLPDRDLRPEVIAFLTKHLKNINRQVRTVHVTLLTCFNTWNS